MLFAFGSIDIGITRSIDHRTPMLGRDYARDRAWILQIKRRPGWRQNLNVLREGEGAELLTDLAGPAEQEEPHWSRALLGEATAFVGIMRGQQRLPPGAVLEIPFHGCIEASFKRVPR